MNILIVGGGFGGVKAALELAKNKAHTVTLISNSSQFQYYPALFSTATGHSYKETWVPLKEIFKRHKNVTIIKDTAVTIDVATHAVTGESGTSYKYDRAILALGSVTTYFGIDGLDTYSYGIKSEAEIRKLQKHLFDEMSDGSDDEKNYVIIGAGPTGVELAGALGEYLKLLRGHFNISTPSQAKISLIEAAPRVLPRLSEESSARALKRLEKLGINVETDKKVEKQTAEGLMVNGEALMTQTVIWTSGVATAPFYKNNAGSFTINERGKITVDDHMTAATDVYVIGDNAATPFAGLAQTALHDAIFVSRQINGKNEAYKSVLPPSVIPIGHGWALFEWRKLKFGGRLGGFMRRAADIIGYSDVLPLGWAIGAWRSASKSELVIPDKIDLT